MWFRSLCLYKHRAREEKCAGLRTILEAIVAVHVAAESSSTIGMAASKERRHIKECLSIKIDKSGINLIKG